MILNALITKPVSCISVQLSVVQGIHVEEMQNVKQWVIEKFVNAQLDGQEIHKLNALNVGLIV